MAENTAITEVDESKMVGPKTDSDAPDIDRMVSDTKSLSEDVAEWLRLKVQLIQIEIRENIRDEVNALLTSIVVLGLLLIAFLLGLIGAGFYMGVVLESNAFGFAFVALSVAIIALVLGRIQPQWIAEILGNLVPRRWFKRNKED